MTKIIKNTTDENIEILDVGFTIAANSSFVVSPREFLIWAESVHVVEKINNEDLVINDGENDLSPEKGLIYLQEQNAQYLDKIKIDTTGISDQKKLAYDIATNKLKFVSDKIKNYYVNASGLFVTTSTTFVVVTNMTVTPAAGLYAVFANFSGNTSAANKIISLGIFKNGTIVADSERDTLADAASQNVIQSTQSIVQFNGEETCDLRTKVSGSSLSITNRSLILIKLE